MGLLNIKDQALASVTEIITTTTGYQIDFTGCQNLAYQLNFTVTTPAAKAVPSSDISVADDTFTKTSHGFVTGLKGQFTTDTTLPTGIVALTDYFIIKVDANTFKVATSLVNALAGTAVDITGAGVGNQTFTPTAIAGASVKLQKSAGVDASDAAMWSDEGSATNITVTGVIYLEKVDPTGKNYRMSVTLTAGMLSVSGRAIGKGPKN